MNILIEDGVTFLLLHLSYLLFILGVKFLECLLVEEDKMMYEVFLKLNLFQELMIHPLRLKSERSQHEEEQKYNRERSHRGMIINMNQ